MKLLSVSNDAKTVKGESKGYLTGILYLAPYTLSGRNVCPNAKQAKCHIACLNTAGRGAFTKVQKARVNKTNMFFDDRNKFLDLLSSDITRLKKKANNNNMIPCVRLNGTSDIRWENYGIIDEHSDVQFYDYTKITNRKNLPKNYHLTWSYSNASNKYAESGPDNLNWAVVFRNDLPDTFLDRPVINGDLTDLRFLDPSPGYIVGLKAKGKAKKDDTGFVVNN